MASKQKMRISLPCATCGTQTELIDLQTLRFFCNASCYDQNPVIHSTRELRRTPRIRCEVSRAQKCHIFGLNAAKVIFNHYALEECQRIDDETLAALTIAINKSDNLECCSPERNIHDKETEKAFLDVFIHRKRDYESLEHQGKKMYDALKVVFAHTQALLGDHPSLVIKHILDDFELLVKINSAQKEREQRT